jgi:hypothetical protein
VGKAEPVMKKLMHVGHRPTIAAPRPSRKLAH